MRDAHALAAAAGGGLDHHRIADLVGDAHRLRRVLDHAEMARHRRHLGGGGEFLRFDLVAHGRDGARVGPDEDDARRDERFGKGRSLGEKAVAWMHRLGAGLLAGLDDALDRKIAFRGRRGADRHRLIGHLDVQGVAIRLRKHGDRVDAQALRGLDDAASDLAAIGDQDLREHDSPVTRKGILPLREEAPHVHR